VLAHNADYAPQLRARILELRAALPEDLPLPALPAGAPGAAEWQAELRRRGQPSWLGCDWFCAENYAYRCLVEACEFWRSARDPFAPIKREEYAGAAHRAALAAAAEIAGERSSCLERLLLAAVFGNRMDLSFAASRERGVSAEGEDLLIDDRSAACALLEARTGPVHVVLDNAGTELSVDLVLVSRLLELLQTPVVLHVKVHPCFVSDALAADLEWFIAAQAPDARALWDSWSPAARACRAALQAALVTGQLQVAPHAFWNGPWSLWECPEPLEEQFARARLVILKGDAHYRRAVGDALWASETPFDQVTGYFPAPLLCLRTLKSDPIVGLEAGLAVQLDSVDPSWRVNGQRGVACLGGTSQ
jgi:hypothetical protein